MIGPSAVGHDRRHDAAAALSHPPAGARTDPADTSRRPPPRTSNSSCCGTRSPCSAASTRDHAWTGRTGRLRRPRPAAARRLLAIAWSPQTRSCAGTAACPQEVDLPKSTRTPTDRRCSCRAGGADDAREPSWGRRRKGRLAPVFDADILAVSGDPTTDVRALLDVRAVFRAGRRV